MPVEDMPIDESTDISNIDANTCENIEQIDFKHMPWRNEFKRMQRNELDNILELYVKELPKYNDCSNESRKLVRRIYILKDMLGIN